MCPWGKCPGGTCPGGSCPRTCLVLVTKPIPNYVYDYVKRTENSHVGSEGV